MPLSTYVKRSNSRVSSALVQVYLAASKEAYALVEELELEGRDASAARFLATMLVEARPGGNTMPISFVTP